MKISTKILLGFGILIVLILVIGIFSITSFSHSSALFNKMDNETIPKLTTVGEMSQKVAEAHVDFMEFLLSGKVSARDKVISIMRALESLSQDHLNRIAAADTQEKAAADELLKKIKFFSSSAVDVMDMKTRGISDEDLLAAEEKTVRPIFDTMMALLAKQNDIYKSELTIMREDVKASQDRGMLIIIIIAALAIIAGIALSFIYGKRISLPIVNLTKAADNISKGEISQPVTKETNDEIGELAEAFERMRISLKVMIEEETT
ncbi:MAG: MCP four helix bundle domain-containing protein [Acidobacteria bacterium]|jgi:methyl-accepting chemotaxis protein|nr:MCP four helix bundle domain-containing protein [Acidobacteriota bacterium]